MQSGVTTYTYDLAGRLTHTGLPNGVETGYQYDAVNRLKTLEHTEATTLASYAYQYDPSGNRTQVIETIVSPETEPGEPDVVFQDGFERGNLNAWSSSQTDSGDLSVSTDAAIVDDFGLQATINDTNPLYLTDLSPADENHYRARFYFDPNSISMADGDEHVIFQAFDNDVTPVIRVSFRRDSNSYWMNGAFLQDNGEWVESNWLSLTDSIHAIEIDWRPADCDECYNGLLLMWLDDQKLVDLYGYDNQTYRVDSVRLGAVEGLDPDTSGVYYIDAFKSRNDQGVGLDPNAPPAETNLIFEDNFESGDLDRWSSSETDDGNLAVSRYGTGILGSYDLQVIIAEPQRSEQEPNWEQFEHEKEQRIRAFTKGSEVNEPSASIAGMMSQASAATTTIDYEYDSLNRLTAADYSDGTYFHYNYDAVGNRVWEETQVGKTCYRYDIANRLERVWSVAVGEACGSGGEWGVSYGWDDNGNLLFDGTYTYSYTNNKLSSITDAQNNELISYQYNGLGNRVSQTVNGVTTNHVLDQAAGLTQVLEDGTNTYLYGNGRIAQFSVSDSAYYLTDALGSVRQLVDGNSGITLTKSYEPYGEILSSAGSGASTYGYTGEMQDVSTGLVYLRARYYAYRDARFLTRDSWKGDYAMPMSYNGWLYGYANPQRYTDPTGFVSSDVSKEAEKVVKKLSATYGITVLKDWGMRQIPVPVPGQQNECAWKNGRWSLWDLKLLEYSVERLSDRMNGNQKFRHFIGPVTVVKTPDTCGRGCTYNFFIYRKIAFIDTGKPAKEAPFSSLIMTQAVDFDAWSVVHELGHAWDNHFHNRLSAGLEEQTGGNTDPRNKPPNDCDPHEPGCNGAGYYYGGTPPKGADSGFNRLEDFAESVASYVFPGYAQYRVRSEYYNTVYEALLYYEDYSATERYRYIDTLINDDK